MHERMICRDDRPTGGDPPHREGAGAPLATWQAIEQHSSQDGQRITVVPCFIKAPVRRSLATACASAVALQMLG